MMMSRIIAEIDRQKRINDKAIKELLESLVNKLKYIKEEYESTGKPAGCTLDFAHETIALMSMMSFASRIGSIEYKASMPALPIPRKDSSVKGKYV